MKTIPKIPGWVEKVRFGAGQAKEQCDFHAKHYEGWLQAICYGGTAFAIECDSSQVAKLLSPMMEMTEYEVIEHCNKTDGWYVFDYYDNTIREGKARIFVMNEKSELLKIIQ